MAAVLSAAVFGLSACQISETPEQRVELTATPELPTEGPKTGSTTGDSPGKPTPPIAVRYEVLGEPQIGVPLNVRITTLSAGAMSNFGLDVRGDAGLSVAPRSNEVRIPRTIVNEPSVNTVTVTPLQEGSLFLRVLVHGDINGETLARSVTIPIQVGVTKSKPKSSGQLGTDDSGEQIISLPADEDTDAR